MKGDEKANKTKKPIFLMFSSIVLGIIIGIFASAFFYLNYKSVNTVPITKLGDTTIALSELKSKITEKIKTTNTVSQSGAKIKITPEDFEKYSASYLNVSENGVIVVRAIHYGQILVMEPQLSGSEVIWKCMGEPKKWVHESCKWNI